MRKPSLSWKSPRSFGPAGAAVLRVLFALAAIIATFATYLSVSDVGNTSTTGSPLMFWLLVANLVVILFLAAALTARIWRLVKENQETGGGARLRLRIIALFGLAAMVPTVVVAAFMGTLINRSVENWFSERVYSVIGNAAEAAGAAQESVVADVVKSLRETATDLNDEPVAALFETAPEQFKQFLSAEADLRALPTLVILDRNRKVRFHVSGDQSPVYIEMSELNWIASQNGQIAVDVSEDFSIRAMIKLSAYDDIFLYAAKQGPKAVAAQLQKTQTAITGYKEADARKNALRTVFILAYLEAALLVLLGTAWLGMHAAGLIAAPIGALAGAARAVRDGDLTVRLDRPKAHDEVDDLTEAFNQMTMRLARQTKDLETSRTEAVTRSAFIETVLSGVEAGVLRVDASFNITLANASAARLIGLPYCEVENASLQSIAPEFLAPLRQAIALDNAVGANIKRTVEEGELDIHVRISPETERDGYIITFHDTTRLVAAQRQAAWRDVARRIAHEIRNPLTPIQLSAERLKRRFGKQIKTETETFDRCVSTILRQVDDIGRMVEEFSSFARMPKPTLAPFDLRELVKSVGFAQRLAAPSVSVTVNTFSREINIFGDERMLGQALTNVVKNACESVERHVQSGEIKSGSVNVSVEQIGDNARIRILDTGVGFPVEDRARFLEPYVTTRESGVGLGLAIVTRIIEDHGGHITLGDNDEAGHGACVDIMLPINQIGVDAHGESAHEGVE